MDIVGMDSGGRGNIGEVTRMHTRLRSQEMDTKGKVIRNVITSGGREEDAGR